LPKRQTKVLLQIFLITLSAGIFSFKPLFSLTGINIFAVLDVSEYLHISIFFISLLLAYMITYSAIEADSPSLVMVLNIAGTGPAGLDKVEFDRIINDDVLVKPRVHDLVIDKMVYLEGDRYRLTRKGVLLSRIFIIYRKILGAGKGG